MVRTIPVWRLKPLRICGSSSENSAEIKIGWGDARRGSGRPRKQRLIQSQPRGPRWYVFEIVAGQEAVAVADLAVGEHRPGHIFRPEFEAFLPLTNVVKVRRGKRSVVTVAMLKGYGFVRFDVDRDEWRRVLTCEGVRRIFATRSGLPIPVTDLDVRRLRALSETELGLDKQAMTCREPGAKLIVADGPFTSFDAVCVRCDGITTVAEVSIFGRSVSVTLPWMAFEGVEAA